MSSVPAIERYLVDLVSKTADMHAANAANLHPAAAHWRFKSVHELIMTHGRLFTPRDTPPDQLRTPQECYRNASEYADENPDAVYVEGLAVRGADPFGLEFEHGWCAVGAEVVDPTWPAGQAYLGVPVRTSFRRRRQLDSRHWTLLWCPDVVTLLEEGLPEDALVDVGRPLPRRSLDASP